MEYRLPYFIRRLLSYIEGFRTNKWFKFDPAISMSYVPSVQDKYIPNSDIIFVTWWTTAIEVGKLSKEKGHKVNLIQGFENWTGHDDLLYQSYNLDDTVNVVVASYLEEIVKKYTKNPTILIPNAIDDKQYHITDPIEKRNPFSICMMYSIQEIKGSEYGLKALFDLKGRYPELRVDLFGICPKPEGLPETWITYYHDSKDLCKIYNKNSIFISNSFTEGMALTPMEAMQCGCALICTDIPGHSEYAKNEETALLYEVKNVTDLISKVSYLIDNNLSRIELAKKGNKYIKQFSWDKAVEKMNVLIKNILNQS